MRQYVYDGTLGCCGLISNWIQLALSSMHADRSKKLQRSHFRSGRLEQQIDEIRRDIVVGESLLTLLPDRSVEAHHPPSPIGRRYPPGKRNPTRDRVRRHATD